MSWFVDPENLIAEVESRPILYAKVLAEYSNKVKKNNAWEEVTKNLSDDWDALTNEEKNARCKDIQAKWKHIRDNFRREFQTQKDTSSGQVAKKKRKYRYYDELLFLIPYIKEAKASENCNTPSNSSENNTESSSIPKIEHSPSEQIHEVSETLRKKKKFKSSVKDETLNGINNEGLEMDEDKTFCLSLVQSLKRMDDDNKILAKIEILKLIRRFSNRTSNIYQ